MKINKNSEKIFEKLVLNNRFYISKHGRIEDTLRNAVLGHNCGDYIRVTIRYKNKTIGIQAHRLIWIYFKGNIPDEFTINHKDGKKKNNRLSNLECVTESANVKHAYNTGLASISELAKLKSRKRLLGDSNPKTAFPEKKVKSIRKNYKKGLHTKQSISAKYNVSIRTVRDMLRGKTYSHIGSPLIKSNVVGRKAKAVLSSKDIDRVISLYRQGYSQKQLASKFLVSRFQIIKALK